MPKYDVTATVTIETQIEPEGRINDPYLDQIEDFSAEDFSGYETVEDTTSITLVFTTDTSDEDEAAKEIEELLGGNLSFDSQDIEWEITDVTIESCERQQMTTEYAVSVVRDFLDSRAPAFREHHPLVHEALETLLQQF
jgi:hypothetical protein